MLAVTASRSSGFGFQPRSAPRIAKVGESNSGRSRRISWRRGSSGDCRSAHAASPKGESPGADPVVRNVPIVGTTCAAGVFAMLDAIWLQDERIGELTHPAQ